MFYFYPFVMDELGYSIKLTFQSAINSLLEKLCGFHIYLVVMLST